MIAFLLILLLAVSVFGQDGIQIRSVSDFSGGMVNSLSNSLMQDNMAMRFEDVTLTDIGSMKARPGYRLAYSSSTSNAAFHVVGTHRNIGNRSLYLLSRSNNRFGSGPAADTCDSNTTVLIRCSDPPMICDTIIMDGAYYPGRASREPFFATSTSMPIGAVFAASNSEPFLLRPRSIFPLRPIVVGQPRVAPLMGGGKLSGTYRYRYAIKKSSGDTTRLGAASWPTTVRMGSVAIISWSPGSYALDTILVYRQKDFQGPWYKIGKAVFGSFYIDSTTSVGPSDTARTTTGTCCQTGMTVTIVNGVPQDSTVKIRRGDVFKTPPSVTGIDTIKFTASFSLVYVDSLGVMSSASGVSSATMNITPQPDTIIKISLGSIPVPTDPSIVAKVVLVRYSLSATNKDTLHLADTADIWSSWGILDTLFPSVTSYTVYDTVGSISYNSWPWAVNVNDTGWVMSVSSKPKLKCYWVRRCPGCDPVRECVDTSSGPDALFKGVNVAVHPDDAVNVGVPDSLIDFTPSTVTSFNSRLWAAGNPINGSYLYYSDFGRPSCWPPDHIVSLVSKDGDWINGLFALGDQLLIFQQNSIFAFAGANFYQFQLDEIANNVGLSGPRTLAGSQNEVFFAHQTGIYEIPRGGAISSEPISLPIQNSFDSTASSELTANGVVIGRDYWYSPAPTVYPKTYIYTALPRPHWKVYTIGIKSAALYDPDTSTVDFASRKYILLNNYNHLLRWDYADTTDFDAGGFQLQSSISPFYQSKYFFEGPTRTNVQYVDIEATGACGYLTVALVCNYGQTTISKTLIAPNFSAEKKIRVPFNRTVKNAAVRLEWEGATLVVKRYDIGHIPWDGGKL